MGRSLIIKDNVISFSIKNITIISSILLTSFMVTTLAVECGKHYSEKRCKCRINTLEFPMISDLLAIYDRASVMLFTIFSFFCMMQNIRVTYKIFASKPQLIFGLITTISFFPIAVFDEHKYSFLHGVFAFLFFTFCSLYIYSIN